MRFPCRVSQLRGGEWSVRHESQDLGIVEAHAPTRDGALQKIRDEIRYRLELCPCSGESYQYIQIDVVEES